MQQPQKWKETIDPFKISFEKLKILDVLGYPHARNDVFYCKALFEEKEVFCFIKYASKPDSAIANEVETIKKLDFPFLPQILEYDASGMFVATKEVVGERLSYILQTTDDVSTDYMFEYGKTLAKIHLSSTTFEEVKHRKFFDIPTTEYLKQNNIAFVEDYLKHNKPQNVNKCFCHGDFHYANVLWKNKKIVGVLDWELSGIGNKEFDIAWAIINRPGQKFLKTKKEVNLFLNGYCSIGSCNKQYVKYYMALIYCHFISVDKNNQQYAKFVTKHLKQI